jgi:hypothetical protein
MPTHAVQRCVKSRSDWLNISIKQQQTARDGLYVPEHAPLHRHVYSLHVLYSDM